MDEQPNTTENPPVAPDPGVTPAAPEVTPPPTPQQVYVSRGPKRSIKPLLYIVLVLILIAGAAYSTYAWQHKQVANLNTEVADLNKQIEVLKETRNATPTPSNTATSSSTGTSTGWKTYTATDGTSFEYPATWTLTTSAASSDVEVASPLDSSTGLEYQLSYGPTTSSSKAPDDVVVSSTALGISLAKPLYVSPLDFDSVSGSDIDGLYVSDTQLTAGTSTNPTDVGFTPKSGSSSSTIGFSAVLQPPNYQTNAGEKLATYQGNPYYQTVINIFKSLK